MRLTMRETSWQSFYHLFIQQVGWNYLNCVFPWSVLPEAHEESWDFLNLFIFPKLIFAELISSDLMVYVLN